MKIVARISTVILIIGMLSLVSATGFSPTSLIFNLNTGERQCQQISVDSSSPSISIEDKFAENKDIEWKVTNFDKPASYLSLTTTYPAQISNETGKLEYCLSGTKEGEYHGVLILKEEQSGNSIVQMGIWIKATITPPVIVSTQTSSSPSSSSASGGGSSSIQSTPTENLEENKQLEIEQENEESNPTITGSAIGTSGIKNFVLPIVVIIVLVGILSAYTYYKRRQRWLGYS